MKQTQNSLLSPSTTSSIFAKYRKDKYGKLHLKGKNIPMSQIVCWKCHEQYGLLKCRNKIDYVCPSCVVIVGEEGPKQAGQSKLSFEISSKKEDEKNPVLT